MIQEDNLIHIGRITKARGLKGEVEIDFTNDYFEREGTDKEFFFLELDGIYVPFFWEEYRYKNDHTLLMKFSDVDSPQDAERLVGARVAYPLDEEDETWLEEAELSSYRALTGFQLFQHETKLIGTVEQVDESSSNILLYVRNEKGEELIVPYHDDLLESFDLRKQRLSLNLPEELLTLNA